MSGRSLLIGPNRARKSRATIGTYKVEQRRLDYRDRVFHFVSYEGRPANPSRDDPGSPPAWFLMGAGTRWEAVPQVPGEDEEDVDRRLLEWLVQTLA